MSLPWKTWVPKADRDQDHSEHSIADAAGGGGGGGRTPFTLVRPSFVPVTTQAKSCSLPCSYAGLRRRTPRARNGQKTSTDGGVGDQRKSSGNFRFFWKAKVNERKSRCRRSNDSEESSSSLTASSSWSSSSCKVSGGGGVVSGSSGRGRGGSLRNVQQQKTTGRRAVLTDKEWDLNSNEHLARVIGLQRSSRGVGSRSCESLPDLPETPPQKKSFGLAGKFDLFAACKGNSRVLDTLRRKSRKEARRKVATERARACTGDTSSEDEERQWQRIRRTQFDDELASFVVRRPPCTRDSRRGQAVLEARTERYYKRKWRDGDNTRSPDSSVCVSKSVSPIHRRLHESADVIRLLPTFSSSSFAEATGDSRYSRRAPAPPPRSSSSQDAARPRGRRPLSYAFDNRHLPALVRSAEVEVEAEQEEVDTSTATPASEARAVQLPGFRVSKNISGTGNVAARLSFTTSASIVYTHTFVEPAANASAAAAPPTRVVVDDDGIHLNDSQTSSEALKTCRALQAVRPMLNSPITPQKSDNYVFCNSRQPFRDNNNNRPPPSPSKHAESNDVVGFGLSKGASAVRRMSTFLERPAQRASPLPERNAVNGTHHLASDPRMETFEPTAVTVDRQRWPCGDNACKSMGKAMDNLEDAIQELEVIYRSMRDEDEADHVDGDNKNHVRRPSRISLGYGNDSDLAPASDGDMNASQPDKLTDDLAYRKLNRTGFETMAATKTATSTTGPTSVPSSYPITSYLLLSPALSPAISADDLHADRVVVARSESDRAVFDDVTFRNMRDANLQKKVLDPQPPFGIPLVPFSRTSSTSDYLHVETQEEDFSRQKTRRRFTPDVVHDDLAYRNLRKDAKRRIVDGASTPTMDHPSAKDDNSRVLNFEELDNIVIFDARQLAANRRRERAVKSLSANVGHMIAQRNDHRIDVGQPRVLADVLPDNYKSLDDLSMIIPATKANDDRKRIIAAESKEEVIAKGLMRFKRHSLAWPSTATMESANVASTADCMPKPKHNQRSCVNRIRPSSAAADACQRPTINCGMDYGSVSDSAPIYHSCHRRVRIEGRAAEAAAQLSSWSSTRRLLRPMVIDKQAAAMTTTTKTRQPNIESKISCGVVQSTVQPIDESRLDDMLSSLAQIGGGHHQTDFRNNNDVLSVFTVNDDRNGEIYIRLPLPGLGVSTGLLHRGSDDYDCQLPPLPTNV